MKEKVSAMGGNSFLFCRYLPLLFSFSLFNIPYPPFAFIILRMKGVKRIRRWRRRQR